MPAATRYFAARICLQCVVTLRAKAPPCFSIIHAYARTMSYATLLMPPEAWRSPFAMLMPMLRSRPVFAARLSRAALMLRRRAICRAPHASLPAVLSLPSTRADVPHDKTTTAIQCHAHRHHQTTTIVELPTPHKCQIPYYHSHHSQQFSINGHNG